MKARKRLQILRAVIFTVMLTLLTGLVAPPAFMSSADELSDLQNKYKNLEKQINTVKQQIENNKKQVTSVQKQLNDIEQEISLVTEQIGLLGQQISQLNSRIASKEQEIKDAQKRIDDNTEMLKQRLCALYEVGNVSYLAVLLSSDNLFSFLNRCQLLQYITEHDSRLLAQLKADKQAIEREKKAIEEDRAKVLAAEKEQESKRNDLRKQRNEESALLATLKDQGSSLAQQSDELEKLMKQAEAQIQEIIRERQQAGSYVGGQFLWPVPSISTYISSPFGWRIHPISHKNSFHNGIDIAGGGIYGQPIVAANAGTVIKMASGDPYFGKYIIIDHGGNISTLYGHEYKFAPGLKEGQKVSRGQTIAYVGSEGRSTGPHLHFCVLENGQYVNPLKYTYAGRK